jgi:hypothetical protein
LLQRIGKQGAVQKATNQLIIPPDVTYRNRPLVTSDSYLEPLAGRVSLSIMFDERFSWGMVYEAVTGPIVYPQRLTIVDDPKAVRLIAPH